MNKKGNKDIKVTITVNAVPHPNPERAIYLVANLILKQILEAEKQGVTVSN